MKKPRFSSDAKCEGGVTDGRLHLTVSGRLDNRSVGSVWPQVHRLLSSDGVRSVTLEGSGIAYCDGAGIALLVYVRRAARRMEVPVEFKRLKDTFADLLALYPELAIEAVPAVAKNPRDLIEEMGKAFVEMMQGLHQHISFLGELSAKLLKTVLRPSGLRVRDFLMVAETSGARALPIIAMLGFLVGLIMAFQGAVLMAQFGAEIYIADFVGKSVARELGPLITAIIVAGRTGSAFAAEIGTMKVNEEIDAFATMGLDPVRFLVVPRVTAATLMTPLLAVMTNLFGMAGGAVVMRGLGFPLITYVNRIFAAVTTTDFVSGLVKALVFGLLISSSGCLCGLRTGEGASAVGRSATRAVVSSITMIVIADGVFAVLFYFLGV
jgi:phospholipid/cholesterol/gamma-HCH transport system permease protein